jgi:WD40 repeat protein
VTLNRDRQWLAAACYGGLFVWNAVTGERLWVASDSYSSVSFGGGGKLLAALTEQGSGQIWDVATHTLSSTLPVFIPQQYCEYCGTRGIAFFAFMPDGKTLAYSADSQTIKLRDAQTGYNYPQSTFCDGDLLSVTFSADSKLIGMACMGSHDYSFGQLEAFTPNGAESIGSYGGTFGMLERDYIGELLFDPNGTYLLVDRLWLFGVVSQRTER